jgi:hypothetical protein
MKKILFLFLIFASSILKSQTLIDSYSETNQDGGASVSAGSFNNQIVGQSFTGASQIYGLQTVKFYLRKSGSPTGSAYAKLYSHDGTYGSSSLPTGSALATSSVLDVSTLTTEYQLITFTFSEPYYDINATTYYVITFDYAEGNNSNYIEVGLDSSSPSHSGNSCYYTLGSWTSYTGWDFVFYVYGASAVTGAPQIIIIGE